MIIMRIFYKILCLNNNILMSLEWVTIPNYLYSFNTEVQSVVLHWYPLCNQLCLWCTKPISDVNHGVKPVMPESDVSGAMCHVSGVMLVTEMCMLFHVSAMYAV